MRKFHGDARCPKPLSVLSDPMTFLQEAGNIARSDCFGKKTIVKVTFPSMLLGQTMLLCHIANRFLYLRI